VSDPLKSEASPSSKKLPFKMKRRKWQKYQRRWLRGKVEKVQKAVNQLNAKDLVVSYVISNPRAGTVLGFEQTGSVLRLIAERPRQQALANGHSILEYPRL
jgi:hypothetical protein